MDQKYLSKSYLSNAILDPQFQAVLSAYGNAVRDMVNVHYTGMAEVAKLSSDFFIKTSSIAVSNKFQPALKAFMDSINESFSQSSVAKNAIKELTKEIVLSSPQFETTDTTEPDADYVLLNQSAIKEYELPETVAIPVGRNRIKIKFDTLLAIISIIIALFSSLKPSATEQKQLVLQQTEVQILSEILENSKATNSTTSEKLDALQESVDELNSRFSNIEQYLKENSQSGNNDTKSK